MALFFRRVMGVLSLDAGTFEDIEADRHAAFQSMLVVVLVCVAAGVGAAAPGIGSVVPTLVAMVMALGAWLLWATVMVTLGTTAFAVPQTRLDGQELLRVLGYSAAPGLFLVLTAMRSAAPFVIAIVAVWMIAAAVIAVRQAFDYTQTGRAIAVCTIAFAITAAMMIAVSLAFSKPVS